MILEGERVLIRSFTCAHKNRISLISWLIMFYIALLPYDYVIKIGKMSILPYIALAIAVIHVFTRRNKNLIVNGLVPIYLIVLSLIGILWSKNGDAVSTWMTYSSCLLVYYICSNIDFSRKEKLVIDIVSVLSSLMLSLVIIRENSDLLMSGYLRLRIGSTYSDPNGIAARFILSIFILFQAIVKPEKGRRFLKIIYIIILLPIIYVFFSTGSRGGFIALLVMVIVTMLLLPNRSKIKALLVLMLLSVVVYYLMEMFLNVRMFERVFTLSNYLGEDSDNGRFSRWIHIIQSSDIKSYLFGYGTNGTAQFMSDTYRNGSVVHNTYLELLFDYGVFGLPAFLYLVARMWKKIKSHSVKYVPLLISILTVAFFLNSLYSRYFWGVLSYLVLMMQNGKTEH